MDSGWLWFLLILGAALVLWPLLKALSAMGVAKKVPGYITSFSSGTCLTGLRETTTATKDCECVVTGEEFAFVTPWGRNLGRIPRDGVNEIIADDKSRMHKRVTVTRILGLGIFALAVPKKREEKKWCVLIDWEDKKGVHQNTVFQFTGGSCETWANNAANNFRKYVKPHAEKLGAGEKKCPFCAEIIRAEATLCRFCHSTLT